MKKIVDYIDDLIERYFGVVILKSTPRHSVRFAERYFDNNPIIAIEIGTYRGIHAQNLFKNLNIKLLYLIDPWIETESYRNNTPEATQVVLSKAEIETGRRLKGKPFIKIKEFSDEAIKKVEGFVDFIYIDGDHSYEQAKKDMFNYWSKLKKDGIMAGHDITNPYDDYSVARAFLEFCSHYKLNPKISRIDWWVVKK